MAAAAASSEVATRTREQRIEALLRAQDSLLSGGFLDDAAASASRRPAAAAGALVPATSGDPRAAEPDGAGLRRCRPWSRDDLLERARTFRIGVWSAPPPGLRPLECARHGWFVAAPQTLECSCGARLVFARPEAGERGAGGGGAADGGGGGGGGGGGSTSDADVLASADGGEPASAALERAIVARVVQSLRTAHKLECPWRDSSCPATFLGYPPLEPKATLTELRCRAATHTAVAPQQLPRVRPLSELGVTAEQRAALWAALGLPPTTPEDSPQAAAATLALFGWAARASEDSGSGSAQTDAILSCELCFRRVGSWQFQRHGDGAVSSRPQKRLRISIAAGSVASSPSPLSDELLLDPIEQHRAFCPCIMPPAAAAAGAPVPTQTQAGYQYVLASLLGQIRRGR
jgi:hypothetical protein